MHVLFCCLNWLWWLLAFVFYACFIWSTVGFFDLMSAVLRWYIACMLGEWAVRVVSFCFVLVWWVAWLRMYVGWRCVVSMLFCFIDLCGMSHGIILFFGSCCWNYVVYCIAFMSFVLHDVVMHCCLFIMMNDIGVSLSSSCHMCCVALLCTFILLFGFAFLDLMLSLLLTLWQSAYMWVMHNIVWSWSFVVIGGTPSTHVIFAFSHA